MTETDAKADADLTARGRAVARWITVAGALVVVAGVIVGGFAVYRAYAIRSFVETALHGDRDDFAPAAWRLHRLGSLDEGLREALAGADAADRIPVVEDPALATAFVPVVTGLLDEDEPLEVRRNAIQLLWELAGTVDLTVARLAIEAVASNESDAVMRYEALRTYGEAFPGSRAPQFAHEALHSSEPRIQVAAAWIFVLGDVVAHREELTTVLLDVLDSPDTGAVHEALTLLKLFEWDARPHFSRLERIVDHPDRHVRFYGMWLMKTLSQNEPEPALNPADVIAKFREVVRDRAPSTAAAIIMLGQFGEAAAEAVPDLVAALADEEYRDDAAEALLEIDREAAIAAGVDPMEFAGD